jgi:hypothetical protein
MPMPYGTKTLKTWNGKQEFLYSGSVTTGTEIRYGDNFYFKITIDAGIYLALLEAFAGKEVPIGASRTRIPANSLGAWLMTNVTKTAIASYVGPILINEECAKRGRAFGLIQFNQ